MTINPNNEKYISAVESVPTAVRQEGEPTLVFRPGQERTLDSQRFSLHPVLRQPPDIDRLGRAILEMAMRQTA